VDSELRSLERASRQAEGDEGRSHALSRARLRAGLEGGASLLDFIREEANAEAFELVARVASRAPTEHVFLDGPVGTGKSHLLRALAAARADAFLWTGAELLERAERAVAAGEELDLPRLIIIDDLLGLPDVLAALLRRSLGGRLLVVAGSAAPGARERLGGRLATVGRLSVAGRRELLRRVLRQLGASPRIPDDLPLSGFELVGLARRLVLEDRLGR
jgi:hypothetical protein